jgi:hypothetical protein
MSAASARPARAESGESVRPLRLGWDAPAGCPAVDDVRAAVEAMLGGAASARDATDVTAQGRVTEEAGGYRLRVDVQTRDGSEVKTIDAASCATLADAYAVVVAFAIDPRADVSRAPRDGVALSAPPPGAQTGERAPASATRPPSSFRVVAGPQIASGVGQLPFPAYGLGGRLALETRLRWELSAAYWPPEPATTSSSATPTLGARVSLVSIQPAVCLPVSRSIAPCLGVAGGTLSAAGSGVASPGRGSWWWVAPTASLGVRLSVTRALGVWVRVDAGVLLYRRSFVFENVGPPEPVTAYEPGPAFATLSVEPELEVFSTDPAEARHEPR